MIFLAPPPSASQDARGIIERVESAVGGRERLRALKDVQYEYTYHDEGTGQRDVSLERYVFDGELAWGRYTTHQKHIHPDLHGEIVQGYDGSESWATLEGTPLTAPEAVKLAYLARKTNYYWFAMMFKLLDPGVTHEYAGTREVGGIDYDIVTIGFEEGVGDSRDTFLLYVNPETGLVDQFLFTARALGGTEPRLMRVRYRVVEGLKLPVHRSYIAADWDGTITGASWTRQIMQDIRFANGFDRSLFAPPNPN